MFCVKCGKQVPEGGEFCAFCGTKSPVIVEEKPTSAAVIQSVSNNSTIGTATQTAAQASLLRTSEQPKQHWNVTFMEQWRSMLPQALFLSFAIVSTLWLILRVVFLKDIGEMSLFSSEYDDLLSAWEYDGIKGVRAVIDSVKFFAFVLKCVPVLNFAYCVLLGIGIWCAYSDTVSSGIRPVETKCYSLMLFAQKIMIATFAVGAISLILIRINIGSFLRELKTDFIGEYYLSKIKSEVYDPIERYAGLCVVCGAYHIIANIMLKRVKSCAESLTPHGLQFSMVFGVICFIVGGLFLMVSIWVIAVYFAMEGVALIMVHNKYKTMLNLYEENRTQQRYVEVRVKQTAMVPQYVPAWKRAQDLQNEE